MTNTMEPEIYQGQFGQFTITEDDRRGVVIYRAALTVAALSFALGTGLVLWQGTSSGVLNLLTPLYACFCLGLGISLLMIHIYMVLLHRVLQIFWAIGTIAALALALTQPAPLALVVYQQPLSLLGIGFTFAALTGIFFKEAFCFDRLETKVLTLLVPLLLLAHLVGALPNNLGQVGLGLWAVLFLVFALRKVIQAIPPDIGDKSVFVYLETQKAQRSAKA